MLLAPQGSGPKIAGVGGPAQKGPGIRRYAVSPGPVRGSYEGLQVVLQCFVFATTFAGDAHGVTVMHDAVQDGGGHRCVVGEG